MEENQITIVDEKGNEHLCEIIFTFDAEKFGKKSYVVFSPIGEVDEDGDQIYDAMAYEQKCIIIIGVWLGITHPNCT